MRSILNPRFSFLRFSRFSACETRISELLYIRYRYFRGN